MAMAKIIADPKIMLGKPTVAGTRITVEQILRLLAQKLTIKEILEDFPQLKEEDIRVAVKYAAKIVSTPKPRTAAYQHEIRS